MKKIHLKNILVLDFILLMALFFLFKPFTMAFGDKAFADELNGSVTGEETSFPLTKTFTISAYYSPLPCQNRYVTGSYAGDVRLNGEGVHSADGSLVYPGMVAAPKSYAFGTKMDVPGVGIVAVHDRGGAIVAAGSRSSYDRLDIWMGYGDKGLKRALEWGKRTMEVVVYGVNDSISEQVTLGDYSEVEAVPNECNGIFEEVNNDVVAVEPAKIEKEIVENKVVEVKEVAVKEVAVKPADNSNSIQFLSDDLKFGDSGEKVIALQQELKKLNLYRTEITGNYGEITKHAVFKFQQAQGLVLDENSIYAGVFGAKTRANLNHLVAAKSYNEVRIASATENYNTAYLAKLDADRPKRTLISLQLKSGMRGPEVAELQKFLKEQGFFEGNLITQYYGPVTEAAVLDFQKAHNIVGSQSDNGAGNVGPATLELINALS